jgi:hypothetical protein
MRLHGRATVGNRGKSRDFSVRQRVENMVAAMRTLDDSSRM